MHPPSLHGLKILGWSLDGRVFASTPDALSLTSITRPEHRDAQCSPSSREAETGESEDGSPSSRESETGESEDGSHPLFQNRFDTSLDQSVLKTPTRCFTYFFLGEVTIESLAGGADLTTAQSYVLLGDASVHLCILYSPH